MSAASLEEIGLGKVAQRLVGVLSRTTTDLVMNLIVKVFSQGRIGSMLIRVPGSGNELLELDTGNEILIRRGHKPIVLGQDVDLVVSLGTLRVFLKECSTFLFGKVNKLLWMRNNGALVTQTWTGWNWKWVGLGNLRPSLLLARRTVWVLQDLHWLGL
jgi:hypothetical protein